MKPVPRDATIRYAVPDFGYRTDVTASMTKEGYEQVAQALRKNVALSVLVRDEAHFGRFMRDWGFLVEVFRKAGVLTGEEAEREKERIRAFPQEASRENALRLIELGKVVRSWSWKKIAVAGIAAGAAFFLFRGEP